MLEWLIRLIRHLLRLLEDLFHRLNPPEPPPPSCPIGWQPSAVAPVFYGMRNYGADTAPGPCQVFFPSLDGAIWYAPILEGCGRYPLILFAHGHCGNPNESEHYRKWHHLPAQLARSGYVVVVPEIPFISTYPWTEDHAGLTRMAEIVAWMREGWEHRNVLLPPPATGVAGHSYGALLGSRFAAENAASAYASIAGVWGDWSIASGGPWPIVGLEIPKFLCWGTDDQDTDIGMQWDALTRPKHKAVFQGARHWDYLSPGATLCEQDRGPCTLTGTLTADLVTMFFSRYLPPENWPALRSQIPANLVPPALVLTTEQQFFAGGHLLGFSLLGSRPECQVMLSWDAPGLIISPTSISFGPLPLGSIGSRTLTIENATGSNVTVSFSASPSGVFDWPAFSGVLPNGQSHNVTVEFTPGAPGPAHDTLAINSTAAGSPHLIQVSGTGVGGGTSPF